jgi:DNA gyrase subunit B
MYIGDLDQFGLQRMVLTLVRSSLAESAHGFGRSIDVILDHDGSIQIEDIGRGIDGTPGNGLEKSNLEAILTEFYCPGPVFRRPFDYTVANALSEWFHVESRYEGRVFRQRFRRGDPESPPDTIGACSASGLVVSFKPDPAIFPEPRLSSDVLRERLREYAFLHSGVRITLTDRLRGSEDVLICEDGIREFVRLLNVGQRTLHPEIVVVRGEDAGVWYEAGLQWCVGLDETMPSFVNDHPTIRGGTHLSGLLEAVTRSVNGFIREGRLPGAGVLNGYEASAGLTAVVSVRVHEPIYESATTTRLNNAEVRPMIARNVGRALTAFFASHPALPIAIIRKVGPDGDGKYRMQR